MSKEKEIGDALEWRGMKCIIGSSNGRRHMVIQDFCYSRVTKFTPTQRDWLVHWLRTVATTAKKVEVTVESLVAMANCIEESFENDRSSE